MRAAVMTDWQLRVDDVPDPVPGPGQVLTKVLSCGICGSDLHMLQHGEELRRVTSELESEFGDTPEDPMRPKVFDPALDTVMGHEFCCEVVELGPEVTNLSVGDVVVSMPVTFDASGVHAIGYSNEYPGGYGELMVLHELLAVRVPDGLPHRLAAMTEPLAVGVHAVNKSRIAAGDAAIVLGLGPVGLACVAELKMRGIGPIVGADLSPRRRLLGEHLGCDVVVDPLERSAISAWRDVDGRRPLVIFEAVGVPGMIDQAMRMAPKDSRILVVGVCMQQDRIHPMAGIGRELSVQFALGYTPEEFGSALRSIAEGRTDIGPMITGAVSIEEVPRAFADLGNPEQHAKILVEP
jgi:threonine dehydrogenase-like Zn-dependent dehydrogenase